MSISHNFSANGGVLSDIRRTWRELDRWTALAWFDFASQHRRTLIGPFWQTIQLILLWAVITLLLGTAFGRELKSYAAYVGTGLVAWEIISSAISEGPRVITQGAGLIRNVPIIVLGLVVQKVAYFAFRMVFHLPIVLIAVFVFADGLGWTAILSVFALVIFLINAGWISLLFGCVGVYFRGIRFTIPALTRFLFFATPIFWYADSGLRYELSQYNPLAHFITTFRAPLLGDPVPNLSWLVVLGSTIVGWAIALLVYRRVRHSIIFWL